MDCTVIKVSLSAACVRLEGVGDVKQNKKMGGNQDPER